MKRLTLAHYYKPFAINNQFYSVLKLFPKSLSTLSSFEPAMHLPNKMTKFVGSIDQGTSSSRFMVFDQLGNIIAQHQTEFEQIYPQAG